MADTLLEVKISDSGGHSSSMGRTVIVSQTITFYNLHRAVQYCVKPRQSDSTIDGKAFEFKHIPTKKAITAPKTTQVNKHSSNNSGEASIGLAFTYTADEKRYRLEVTDRCRGDGRYRVPRCVAGRNGTEPADLDTTNSKLLVRKFSKIGSGQKKQAKPGIVTSELAQLNAMKRPLRWWRADSGSLEVELMLKGDFPRDYLVQQAIKAAGPEAAAEVPYPADAGGPAAATTATQHSQRSAGQEPAAAGTDSVPAAAEGAPAQASTGAAGATALAAVTAVDNAPVAASVEATKTSAATAAPAVLARSQADNKVPVPPVPAAASKKGTLLGWLTKQPAKA